MKWSDTVMPSVHPPSECWISIGVRVIRMGVVMQQVATFGNVVKQNWFRAQVNLVTYPGEPTPSVQAIVRSGRLEMRDVDRVWAKPRNPTSGPRTRPLRKLPPAHDFFAARSSPENISREQRRLTNCVGTDRRARRHPHERLRRPPQRRASETMF